MIEKLNKLKFLNHQISLIFALLIILPIKSYSDTLFYEISDFKFNNSNEDYIQKLISSPVTKSYKFVKINKLVLNRSIFINLDEKRIFEAKLLKTGKIINVVTNDESIYGSFMIKNNRIRGYINYNYDKYEIKPIDPVTYLIILLDQTKIPSEYCDFEKHYPQLLSNDDEEIIQTIQDECYIRVLVAYTPAARNERGGDEAINAEIDLAIELTNQSYENSQVHQRIELARTVLTNYNESVNILTNLNRLIGKNDGYMDEIHYLRDMYSADCVVLVYADSSVCGVAPGIFVTANYAFCLVSSGDPGNPNLPCLTYNYSFAHELGHLMGCRHQLGQDPNNNPFPYGHGYCDQNGNWRTIMSYRYNSNNTLCGNSRINYWSNPYVYYQGQPMGTPQCCNNVRVLNETEATIREFRITPMFLTIPDHFVPHYNIANFLAKSYLESSENFICDVNSDVTFRAGDMITLKNGFQARSGCKFHAFIDNCGDTPSAIISANIADNTNLYYILFPNYPNPFSDKTEIVFNLPKESQVQLMVYNSMGIAVATLVNNETKPEGEHRVIFDSSYLPAGIYFYSLRASEYYQVRQMILLK